ncbi:UDP-2,4-diacetamido-2,4,6-trideoxy-beta-L-altropyranose hydrolase [Sulfurimonas sp. NWX367]|uniref:UDP-2,4-diacetamido-2,4, 6-trideoxy-beta-L-altropyranose hydrolase n=1 Tax=Sulfurimonas sp. NWX367 TaxID=2925413 RepID=UPI003204872C
MNQNILFRVDSSSNIGTGHIMRDLVLAQQYKNANIIFATLDLEGNANERIEEAGYAIELLKSNTLNELHSLIKKLKIDLLVIDHYEIDEVSEKALKTKNPTLKILSFDDTYEKHYCDILLNHNISADESRYKSLVPSFCEIRCGADYTLLRNEFIEEKKIKREKIYEYFIAMGGADTANLNIKILEILPKNKKVALVTTTANKNLTQLQEYVKDKVNISLFINSKRIAKLMNQSQLAIITPSVTVNEVYFLGVDFVVIKTADNQENIYEYLKKNHYKVLSEFSSEALNKIISVKLVNFTDLSLDEKKMVLEWRNDDTIKKWMFNTDPINLKAHLSYIDLLSSKEDKIYFLVKQDTSFLGVVNFTEITTLTANIGLYTNPKLKGVGSILMNEILNYGFEILKVKKLISEVFEENKKAIKLYVKFGFITVKRRENICIMELTNENR